MSNVIYFAGEMSVCMLDQYFNIQWLILLYDNLFRILPVFNIGSLVHADNIGALQYITQNRKMSKRSPNILHKENCVSHEWKSKVNGSLFINEVNWFCFTFICVFAMISTDGNDQFSYLHLVGRGVGLSNFRHRLLAVFVCCAATQYSFISHGNAIPRRKKESFNFRLIKWY